MAGDVAQLPDWARRYGLALCCVVAPLVLALASFNGVLNWLTPDIAQKIDIHYVLNTPKPDANKATTQKSDAPPAARGADASPAVKAGSNAASENGTAQLKSSAAATVPPTQAAATAEAAPDPALTLRALQYGGEARYATASAFIYLASAAVLLFSLVIVYQRLKWKCLLSSLTVFVILGYAIAFISPKPRGRELVVENLLNAVEASPIMRVNHFTAPKTGDMVSLLVSINTIAALVPVGMLLMALAALSIRDIGNGGDAQPKPDPDDLRLRRNCLRIALGLGSALFVIGVLADKTLVDWPLSLVIESQKAALQPIADSVTLQLGTMGTIAIIAAFAPAIVAWWLDVQNYRASVTIKKKDGDVAPVGSESAPSTQTALETPNDNGQSDAQQANDEFVFAPISTISGIIAALAPLLASPFIDTLKSVLLEVGGK